MKRLRGKLTYANVIATLALFLVLAGGSALAASKLAKNSVGTKQIKNNAISASKIKDGAVTAKKLNAGAVGRLTGPAGAKGERGPSNGFATSLSDDPIAFTGEKQVVASLSLPVGSYILNAFALANNNDVFTEQTVDCKIIVGGDEVAHLEGASLGPNEVGDRVPLALTGGGTLSAPGVAQLSCTATTATGNFVGVGLTAVQVGSLSN